MPCDSPVASQSPFALVQRPRCQLHRPMERRRSHRRQRQSRTAPRQNRRRRQHAGIDRRRRLRYLINPPKKKCIHRILAASLGRLVGDASRALMRPRRVTQLAGCCDNSAYLGFPEVKCVSSLAVKTRVPIPSALVAFFCNTSWIGSSEDPFVHRYRRCAN